MSSELVRGPRLRRIARRAGPSRPIARSTCEAPTLPDEQAAPALTATPFEIEGHDQRLGVHPGVGDGERVGQARHPLPDRKRARHQSHHVALEAVAQRGDRPPCLPRGVARRGPEGGDGRQRLGARAQAELLAAAAQFGREFDAVADDQDAGALHPTDLVPGERHEIDLERAQRPLAGGLDRIAVQHGPMGARDRRHLLDRLHDPGLVVGRHDRDERGAVPAVEQAVERVEIDAAVARHRNRLRPRHGGQDRGMLDGRDQEAPASAPEGQMVGLRAAAGEDHLPRGDIRQPGDLGPGPLQESADPAALGMNGGGVAGESHRLQGRLPGRGQQRRRGVMVEIDARGHGVAPVPRRRQGRQGARQPTARLSGGARSSSSSGARASAGASWEASSSAMRVSSPAMCSSRPWIALLTGSGMSGCAAP